MSENTKVDGIPGKKCVYTVEQQSALLKTVFVTLANKNPADILTHFVAQSAIDAEMARKVEIMKDGHPGFFANLHSERGAKIELEILKQESLQKQTSSLSVTGDLAEKLLEKAFETREVKVVDVAVKDVTAQDSLHNEKEDVTDNTETTKAGDSNDNTQS
jgi:hypothetical protein